MTVPIHLLPTHDYFFGSSSTGEQTDFTPKDVKEVFRIEWLEWRKADLQPLISKNLLPASGEVFLDGMLRFKHSSTTVDVEFRNDEARSKWEEFLTERCPWLSYDVWIETPATSISIPVYRQEVMYEGQLMERELLRAIREATFDGLMTVFPTEPLGIDGLKCGDEVVAHNDGQYDEGFVVDVDMVQPHPMSFYRDDDLLTVADCAYYFEVYKCGFIDPCERCEASAG